ncbi:hypothetical protein EHN06_07535 [Marinobacter sp. NP-4(2019)]|uniref:hypothetical protein n=1 Tax=Marinobacter sp. NP-4(2019) TaxID=2488665 RepID=UPI000FC3DA43|nr:hypothetical protein [Marinobacter sp. NP-4(2019)]AZT83410.1 hypothetical protein EHN06_07535 [Marinobacter sp. NP-4(2019)]
MTYRKMLIFRAIFLPIRQKSKQRDRKKVLEKATKNLENNNRNVTPDMKKPAHWPAHFNGGSGERTRSCVRGANNAARSADRELATQKPLLKSSKASFTLALLQ